MGRAKVWHVVIFYRLMVGELAIAGNLSECKRQYPLLEVLGGFTLIDNTVDLDITGADKRLAVSDGELGKRLAIGHRLAMATCDDAGINPVENALRTDRIVVKHGLSTLQQLLVLLCRQSSTNPYAVFHLRFIADSVQRTVVDNRLIGSVAQYARSRTVVNKAGAACITIDKRSYTVLPGTCRHQSRDLTTEMTVADGSLVLVGNAGTVLAGLYEGDNAQTFEQRTLTDSTEQAQGGTLFVVSDGVTLTMEGTLQIDGPILSPIVQVDISCQIEDAFSIIDAGKLAGRIDEPALLGLWGDSDFMSGHRKREGIDVLGVVGERTLEGVATVRCRDGDALQVVVA